MKLFLVFLDVRAVQKCSSLLVCFVYLYRRLLLIVVHRSTSEQLLDVGHGEVYRL